MRFKKFLSFSLPIFLFAGIVILQKQYLKQQQIAKNVDYNSEEETTKTNLAFQQKIPTLGFGNVFADWTFLNFIQYFGDEQARLKTGYPLIPNYFEAIVQKDPHFVQAFLILSSANSIYAGLPKRTVAFLNEALTHITPETYPLAHYLWLYKGVDEMLFLGDLKAAKKSFLMAEKWATQAKEEVTVKRTQEMIRFLDTNPDTKQAKIGGWVMVLNNAKDRKTQQYAVNQLRKLDAKVRIKADGKITIQP
jgi:hypothetical protein